MGKAVVAFMYLGLACAGLAWWLGPPAAKAVTQSLDLSDATFVEIRRSGSVVMSGELRSRVDSLGNVEKDAALGRHQDPVVGEIEIEIPRPGASDPRQELEVDVISLQPFTFYQVFVNDRPAATFTTDDRGSVDIELQVGAIAAPNLETRQRAHSGTRPINRRVGEMVRSATSWFKGYVAAPRFGQADG